MSTLARRFGIQVVDVRPAWRGAVVDVIAYVAVGVVAYALLRLAHGNDGVGDDERDDNYCVCMASLLVAVAAWLS
jgi:hypothetical protein